MANTEQPHKYFEDQFDDEEVLHVFHKHPIVMRKGLILGMGAWLLGPVYTLVLTYIHKSNPPTMKFFLLSLLLSMMVGCILFMPSWISWHFSVFIVTDQRFIQIVQKGLFHRSVADIRLSQIQSVNYAVAGIEETLLGFGTIKMQTYVGDLKISHIHKPAKLQKKLLYILREKGVQLVDYPANQQPNNLYHEEDQD